MPNSPEQHQPKKLPKMAQGPQAPPDRAKEKRLKAMRNGLLKAIFPDTKQDEKSGISFP